VPGALRWEHPGALARHLGRNTHDSPLPEIWHRWHAELDPLRARDLDDARALLGGHA
jgi:hypothetical protein